MTSEMSLQKDLATMGFDLSVSQQERLVGYIRLIKKWNKTFNLTAILAESEMVTLHLMDSLVIVPFLREYKTLADVGSGAGLPGIPLAIALPELAVSLIESNNKKCTFQRQVKIECQTENVEILQGNVESLAEQKFDAVISRAFSTIAKFIEASGHLVTSNGRLFAMKGVFPDAEMAGIPNGWVVESVHELFVPRLDAPRHLVILKQI